MRHHALRMWFEPFRIVAPYAAQRAALQKNGTAYARPVKYGEFLNIKYETYHHFICIFHIFIIAQARYNVKYLINR